MPEWSDKYLSRFTEEEKDCFNKIYCRNVNNNNLICHLKNYGKDYHSDINQWNIVRSKIYLDILNLSLNRNVNGFFYIIKEKLDEHFKNELIDFEHLRFIYSQGLMSFNLLSFD